MSRVVSRKDLVQRALRKVAGESGVSTPPLVPPKLGGKYLQQLEDVKLHHSHLLSDLNMRLERFEDPVLYAIIAGQGVLTRDIKGSTIFASGTNQSDFAFKIESSDNVILGYDPRQPLGDGLDPGLIKYVDGLSGYLLAGLGLYDFFADFDIFSRYQKVFGYEIVWLSLGLNPRSSLVGENNKPQSEFKYQDIEYKNSVQKVQELFDRNFGLNTMSDEKNCMELIKWLDQSKFEAHPEFRQMLKSMSPKMLIPPRKGGRPEKYDWTAFDQEINSYIEKHGGLPKRKAKLTNHMLDWCFSPPAHVQFRKDTPSDDDGPGESTVKQKVSNFYTKMERGNN